jgi:hypothetical protein
VAVPHFNLKVGCAEQVGFYLSKMHYVYPFDAIVSVLTARIADLLLSLTPYRRERLMAGAHISSLQ